MKADGPKMGFQAEMVPLRLANMKTAGAEPPLPFPATKLGLAKLKTCPVGPCGPPAVVGMPTKPLGGLIFTLLTPAIHRVKGGSVVNLVRNPKGLPRPICVAGLNETPQGFCKVGSVTCASPGIFETRSV